MTIDSLHAIPSPHAATARIDHPRTLKYRGQQGEHPHHRLGALGQVVDDLGVQRMDRPQQRDGERDVGGIGGEARAHPPFPLPAGSPDAGRRAATRSSAGRCRTPPARRRCAERCCRRGSRGPSRPPIARLMANERLTRGRPAIAVSDSGVNTFARFHSSPICGLSTMVDWSSRMKAPDRLFQ